MATQKRANSTIGPIGFSPYKIKKGEKYMNDCPGLEHFRNILRLLKQQLMEEVDHTVSRCVKEAAIYSDPIDRAAWQKIYT